jgi:hypothetical protein
LAESPIAPEFFVGSRQAPAAPADDESASGDVSGDVLSAEIARHPIFGVVMDVCELMPPLVGDGVLDRVGKMRVACVCLNL